MKHNHINLTRPMTYREFVLAMKRKQMERDYEEPDYIDDELRRSR